ncbi:MAG: prepilin-type N-terminal cleavage/methylation domain-containing protein [Nitrospirota bacterium]
MFISKDSGLKIKDKRGFTLIELIFVIVIIAILAGTIITLMNTNRANSAALITKAEQYAAAEERFKMDTGTYTSEDDIKALWDKDAAQNTLMGVDVRDYWRGPYIKGGGKLISNNPATGIANGYISYKRSVDLNGNGNAYDHNIYVTNVPSDIANEIDKAIDKESSPSTGRVIIEGTGNLKTVRFIFNEEY